MAKTYNPKLMQDSSLFIESSDLVPIGAENEFYDINDVTIGVKVNSEVEIEGKMVKVLKVMAYKKPWIETYYTEPLKELKAPKKNEPDYLKYFYPKKNEKNNSNCSCCECGCCQEDGCVSFYICGSNICPHECSCYCCKQFLIGVAVTIFIILGVFGFIAQFF